MYDILPGKLERNLKEWEILNVLKGGYQDVQLPFYILEVLFESQCVI